MSANKPFTGQDWIDPDDAPDLSAPEFAEKLNAVEVKRGRPKKESPKISTTIRLDPEILEAFQREGEGWQTRMNDALKDSLARERRRKARA